MTMERYFARFAISTASLLIATFMVVAAFIALWAAVYLALVQNFTPSVAALLTGTGALIFAALVVISGAWLSRRQTATRSHPSQAQKANLAAVELGRILGNQMHSLTQNDAQGAAVAALIAGFAVGASPRLRDFLWDIVAS